ncbi:lipase secretion chaperone [Comamonas endophytica]
MQATPVSDPLLAPGLRHTLEMLLLEAGEAGDPPQLKQRIAALVGAHFPAGLTARALALAERYVDYRVALGQLNAPQDPDDPQALRHALRARDATRLRYFDIAEYDALFAREDETERHALARMEAALASGLDPEQRRLALQAADALLPTQKRAEYSAITEHLAAAEQTAAFDARNADPAIRHAVRSARWGEAAAQALAALDREEQHWQQRLAQYSQALAQPGRDGAALQLRQQLFSAQEQPRIDAALALRLMAAEAATE